MRFACLRFIPEHPKSILPGWDSIQSVQNAFCRLWSESPLQTDQVWGPGLLDA
jgi:hypothetical protein